MKKSKIAMLSLMAGLGVVLVSSPGFAQSAAKDIVGAWALVKADAYGPAPLGLFTFDANGHFSALLMRSDLPKYAANNRTQGTPEEYKATVEGSLGYFGTYSISGTDLKLHIVGSTFANWNGTDQTRPGLSVTADEMKYTQPTPSGGGPVQQVTWRRIR